LIGRQAGTGWLEVLFPPAAMGAVVAVIGLELLPRAATMAGLVLGPGRVPLNHPLQLEVCCVTIAISVLVALLVQGFGAFIPVLAGLAGGYAFALYLGLVDLSLVRAAPWFTLPHLALPTFQWQAIGMILPATAVLLAQHLGNLAATGAIAGRELMGDPGLDRSLLGGGLANVLSGLAGGTPVGLCPETIGVMAVTRVCSVQVIRGAALVVIAAAFLGKVVAAIQTIPAPVLGGVSLLLFGAITAAGIRLVVVRRVDYARPANLVLSALVLAAGMSGAKVTLGLVELKGMALATLVAMVLGPLAWLSGLGRPGEA
jgi:uracil permease